MNGRALCAWAFLGLVVAAGAVIAVRTVPVAAAESQPAANQVKIDNFSFEPQTVNIAVGTTVTWVNNDDVPHTVVETKGAFKSKALDTYDKYSFTFDKPGTYAYFCGVHPVMTGKVIVK